MRQTIPKKGGGAKTEAQLLPPKMAKNNMKRYSASVVIWETQPKTTITDPLERLKIKHLPIPSVGKDVEKLKFSYTAGEIRK